MSDLIVQKFRFYMRYVCNALKSKKKSCLINWLEYAKFSLYEKWNNCRNLNYHRPSENTPQRTTLEFSRWRYKL